MNSWFRCRVMWWVLLGVVGAGLLITRWNLQRVEGLMQTEFLQQAQLIAQALNPERVAVLTGTAQDLASPVYLRVKDQLVQTQQVYSQYRFIYLLTLREDGEVAVLVDSEPAGSVDASSPGEIFEKASDVTLRVFSISQSAVDGPLPDRRGRWFSALVPVIDSRTGQQIAVLGLDIDVDQWRSKVVRGLFLPLFFTLVFSLIILGSFWALYRRQAQAGVSRVTRLNRYTEAVITGVVGLTITLLLILIIHNREERSRQDIFQQLAEAKASLISEVYRDIRHIQLEGLGRFFEASEYVDRWEFQSYTEHLTEFTIIQAWGWVPAVPGKDRFRLEALARSEGMDGFSIWELDEDGQRVPATERETYYPVFYAVPEEDYAMMVGYDLGSETARRRALEIARDTGLMTASDPITLIKPAGLADGIIVFRPVAPSAPEGNQEGYVLSVLDLGDFLDRLARIAGTDFEIVEVDLYQLRTGNQPWLMVSSRSGDHFLPGAFPVSWMEGDPYSLKTPIFMFGKVYLIVTQAGDEFTALYPPRERRLVVLAGFMATGLLTVLIGFLGNHRFLLEEEVRQRTAALRESEEHLAATLQSIGDGVIGTDPTGCITTLNPVAQTLTGWSSREALGRPIEDIFQIVDTQTGVVSDNPVRVALQKSRTVSLGHQVTLIARDGIRRQIADSCALIVDPDRGLLGTVLVFRDVTAEREAEAALRQSENEKALILDSTSEMVAFYRPDMTIQWANRACLREYSLSQENAIGRHCFEVFRGRKSPCVDCPVIQARETGQPSSGEITTPEGETWLLRGYPVLNQEGVVISLVEFGQDITDQKRADERIRYLSFHDALTGLYNRAYLEEEMKRLDTDRQLPLGVIMADVNGLKLVNDTYGHWAGDELLKAAGTALRTACRREDLVARWGGDEFVILLPRTRYSEAEVVCRRILDACRQASTSPVPLSLSLGFAQKENPAEELISVFQRAEDLMYRHKLTEGRSARTAILSSLRKTLREKSCQSGEEAERMGVLARKLGEAVHLSSSELDRLSLLVAVHDIGIITLSDQILHKSGPLTRDEWGLVRQHPETGYRIARSIDDLTQVAEEILSHHEHWNGKGYPRHLEQEAIPLLSRISLIIDAYLAMISDRPWRQKKSEAEALAELQRGAGKQFDPNLVKVFVEQVMGGAEGQTPG